MIEIIGLNKKFNVDILKNINLKLECGNIYILKGISGSGKTTLLNILTGLDKNYEGSCLINGQELKKLKNNELSNYQSNIGYVMQKSLLFKKLTILDNLKLIDDNETEIKALAKKFNVENILKKYPKQISGGERQRIALIRALLKDHSIIILDEPTSSLDHSNSLKFVEYLEKIDYSNKIIIIATHKSIYDNIATSILNIRYGNITEEIIKKIKSNLILKNNYNKISKQFIWSNRKSFGIFFNLIMIIFITSILIVTSIKIKFQSEFIKIKMQDYPYKVLDTNNFLASEIPEIIEEEYQNYVIEEEDYMVYPLLKKEDSVFKKRGVIAYGNFPKNNKEILINKELAMLKFANLDFNNIIGKTLKIKNEDYIITGIIDVENNEEIYIGFYEDINNYPSNLPAAFLDYNKIKNIGTLKSVGLYDIILIKIKDKYLMNVYTTNKYERQIVGFSAYSYYSYQYNHIINNTKHSSNMAIIVMICLSLLLILFLTNQITLELFYKEKEIGYLQIFNFSKRQLKLIYILEYLINILIDFLISYGLYIIIVIFIYLKKGLNYFVNPFYTFLIFIVLILYSLIIIYIPLRKIINKDIIKLIK